MAVYTFNRSQLEAMYHLIKEPVPSGTDGEVLADLLGYYDSSLENPNQPPIERLMMDIFDYYCECSAAEGKDGLHSYDPDEQCCIYCSNPQF
jgi:hypothetical protein